MSKCNVLIKNVGKKNMKKPFLLKLVICVEFYKTYKLINSSMVNNKIEYCFHYVLLICVCIVIWKLKMLYDNKRKIQISYKKKFYVVYKICIEFNFITSVVKVIHLKKIKIKIWLIFIRTNLKCHNFVIFI